ncbi:MAG: molybdopterin-dependent oxidoreductase, partial [Spirochaetota bacterium]|nr:molybdopterin-dependent oxidoreductase [Spirochaetota bacterium]
WKEGISLFKKKIDESGADSKYNKLAFLVSAWSTNEALYLIKSLTEDKLKGSEVYFFSRGKREDITFPGFRISGDKNPNTQGIISIFNLSSPEDKSAKMLLGKINSGSIDRVVVLGGIPGGHIPEELLQNREKLKDIIVIDHSKTELSDKASLVLPGLSFAEKSGSYINDQKRVQRILPAIKPVTGGKPEDLILQELSVELGTSSRVLSTSGVFDEMSRLPVFKGMNYRTLADRGAALSS